MLWKRSNEASRKSKVFDTGCLDFVFKYLYTTNPFESKLSITIKIFTQQTATSLANADVEFAFRTSLVYQHPLLLNIFRKSKQLERPKQQTMYYCTTCKQKRYLQITFLLPSYTVENEN
jgi:hypothetical protein